MEDTLREKFDETLHLSQTCLNPCFNGRYSQSYSFAVCAANYGLNPCFNGRYSQRAKTYVSLYTSIWGMFKLLETLLLT